MEKSAKMWDRTEERAEAVATIKAMLEEIEQLTIAAGKEVRLTAAQRMENIEKGATTSDLVDTATRTMPQRLERARQGKF